MKLNKILKELNEFYKIDDISEMTGVSIRVISDALNSKRAISNKSENLIRKFFDIHASNYSELLTIPELLSSNNKYAVNSPDGWVEIKKCFETGIKPSFLIQTKNHNLKCSDNHPIQMDDLSWEMSKDIDIGDNILCESGVEEVLSKIDLDIQKVYDIEVDHPEHRYWSGGICSHNCGKTFFVQKIIANAQKMGKYVIVFDSENAIDPDSAVNFGIDPTKVKYVTALTIENTRNAIFKFLKSVAESKKVGDFLIVIDSLANMESELGEKRMDKESTSADMGTFAKSVKSLLKTCTNWAAITKTSIVFTNHIYDNPNQMYPSLEKDITGGKYALYMPSVTVQMAKKATKDDEGKTIDNTLATGQKSYSGAILRCLTVKNRFIKPFLEVELYLSFATGLDKFYGLLEIMRGLGVVVLDGKTYKDWNGDSLGYYKNWRKDKEVWKRLLPELESRLQSEWAFSKEEAPYDEEDLINDNETPSEEEDLKEENPLDKLKSLKSKVSKKIDKMEEELEND